MTTQPRCVLSTVESDSHIWNLVYLQRVLEEQGATVLNLGSCTPVAEVLRGITEFTPDLLVVSSINGHGHHGARVLLEEVRRHGLEVPAVVGGKLTTAASDTDRVRRDLLSRGYADVFTDEDSVDRFREFLRFGRRSGFAAWQPPATVVPPWDTVPELVKTGIR